MNQKRTLHYDQYPSTLINTNTKIKPDIGMFECAIAPNIRRNHEIHYLDN